MYHPAPKGSVKRYPGVGGKESVEDVKREVMMVVCQQLRDILVRDMRKSLVEIPAFSRLDSFWKRQKKMVRYLNCTVVLFCTVWLVNGNGYLITLVFDN